MRYNLNCIVKLHVIKRLTRFEKEEFECKCKRLNKSYKFCEKGFLVVKEKDVRKIVHFGKPIGIEVITQEELEYYLSQMRVKKPSISVTIPLEIGVKKPSISITIPLE